MLHCNGLFGTRPRARIRAIARRAPHAALFLSASIAALCGCEAPDVLVSRGELISLEQRALALLTNAGQNGVGVVRSNAIEALVKVAPDRSLPTFRAAVTSESPLVRYAGCIALGETRDKTSLDAIRRLLDDPDTRVRLAAAFAAYRCGDLNKGRVLVDAMRDNPDPKLRADAAWLIGKLGEPKSIRRLQQAARHERDGYVVEQIESATARLGDRESRDRLVEYVLKSDTVTIVLALQTLAEIADPGMKKALEYRLYNEDDYLQMRLLAARALGTIGSDAGYELAAASLSASGSDDSETMQIRTNAALALGAIGQQRALPLLQQMVENATDVRVQVAGCLAICQITRPALEDPGQLHPASVTD